MTTDAEKLRITEFLYEYVQYLDDDRLEEWPDFFVADCLYKIMPRENVERELPLPLWYCDNQHMLHDRVQALRTSQIYNLHYDRHILSNVRVHDEEDGVHPVHANWALFQTDLEGTTQLFCTGKYVDKIVFVDGSPKLKEKLVVLDTYSVPNLLATPI